MKHATLHGLIFLITTYSVAHKVNNTVKSMLKGESSKQKGKLTRQIGERYAYGCL